MAKRKEYYMNNPDLPSIDAKFEYEPEMLVEIDKCKSDLLHFAKNYFFIIDPDEGKKVIPLYAYQVRLLEAFVKYRNNIVLSSRQSGKTTVMTILALHDICFKDHKNVVIVANKEDTAKIIFKRVKLAYEALPNWLKPAVKSWGQTSLELVNGSTIGISTTTGTAARGATISTLLIDEMAFIEPDSIVDDFMKSVLPTISKAKTSKMLITSTPNGKSNVFYRMYTDALKEGGDGWNTFHAERVDWMEMPDRDENWKKNQIAMLGSVEFFNQEYGCEFTDNGTAGIDTVLFDTLKLDCKEPLEILDNGSYKIWNLPDSSRVYVAGIDTSEGVNKDASVIQILDITDIKEIVQVAEYHNRLIPPAEFANKVHEILGHWGNPVALIERNNQGAQICDRLDVDFNYTNIVSWGSKAANKTKVQVGIISHTNTKFKAIQNERYFINEVKAVSFRSIDTLEEFKNFTRYPNGTWKARGSEHDDRVMAFVWALMALHQEIAPMFFNIEEVDDYGKPAVMTAIDMNIRGFSKPTSIYTNETLSNIENSKLSPIVFGNISEQGSDIADLMLDGWSFLGGRGNNIQQDDYNGKLDNWF